MYYNIIDHGAVGGACDNIRIHDIAMHNVKAAAIFVSLGVRAFGSDSHSIA